VGKARDTTASWEFCSEMGTAVVTFLAMKSATYPLRRPETGFGWCVLRLPKTDLFVHSAYEVLSLHGEELGSN